jgi:hypothetical protein
MIKIASTLILLSTLNSLYAMNTTVTLACQEELKKRLLEVGIPHFVEKSNIDRMLGSRNVAPLEVTTILDFALLNYSSQMDFSEEIQKKFAHQFMQTKREPMIRAILQEHPEAIKALKKNGSLEKK